MMAVLLAFVVMPHHVHALTSLPHDADGSTFCRRLKSISARDLLPRLNEREHRMFAQQRGLSGRQFCKRGFHGHTVDTEDVFWQKVTYIHENPVRAGLVERAEDYGWSSVRSFLGGQGTEEKGIDVDW